MGINAPAQKKDVWDKVATALNIANQGIGAVEGVQKIVESATKDPNKLSARDMIEYGKDYTVSNKPSLGAMGGLKAPDGSDVYFTVKGKEDPKSAMSAEAVAGHINRGGTFTAPGTPGATDVIAEIGGKKQLVGLVPPPDATKEIKPDQYKVAQFGQRMQQAENVFAKLGTDGFDPTSASAGAQRATILGLGLPNFAKSGQVQQQEQAERSFVNAVLRRESGAAISNSEFDSAEKQYFPRQGDSPEVLKQKAENRALAINGFKQEAGDAWKKVGQGAAAPTMIAKKQSGPSQLTTDANAGTPSFTAEDVVHFKLAKERLAKNPKDTIAQQALAIAASKGLK